MSHRELKDMNQVERDLEFLFKKKIEVKKELELFYNTGLSPQFEADEREKLNQQVAEFSKRCRGELERLTMFPPRQIHHADLLQKFWRDGSYENSVFIMSKFPDLKQPKEKNEQLDRVLKAISDAVEACAYMPRIARFPWNYHEGLWNNVEIHLLGCSRGIAVVEDRYLPELNPNVMMEWGWMRGMGKRVFFLREKNFRNFRADLGDLLSEEFDWDSPEPGVRAGVEGFLKGPIT